MKKIYYVYNMVTKKDVCMTDEFNHAYQLKKEFDSVCNDRHSIRVVYDK